MRKPDGKKKIGCHHQDLFNKTHFAKETMKYKLTALKIQKARKNMQYHAKCHGEEA